MDEDITVRLTGTTVSVPAGDGDSGYTLDFRYTIYQAYERLACWIRHLFSCAAGQAATRFYVRRKKDKFEQICFASVVSEADSQMLVRYIRLFLDGQRSVIPFVSDVSASYIKAFRKSEADTANARRHEALAKAKM